MTAVKYQLEGIQRYIHKAEIASVITRLYCRNERQKSRRKKEPKKHTHTNFAYNSFSNYHHQLLLTFSSSRKRMLLRKQHDPRVKRNILSSNIVSHVNAASCLYLVEPMVMLQPDPNSCQYNCVLYLDMMDPLSKLTLVHLLCI